MTGRQKKNKGVILEEVLRAYFLRSGFFVIRGVPFRYGDEDLTDVDLWLYERPTGTARRIQICDIKYKQRPKAVERILWTSGLADLLDVDGAYIATTDKRTNLHLIAKRLNLKLIDGNDLQRIQNSRRLLFPDRIGDEELIEKLKTADKARKSRELQRARADILSALSEGFGAPSAVRSLEVFVDLAHAVASLYPNSDEAKAFGRLAYLSAAITVISLDYLSIDAVFRSLDERRSLLLDAVRLGALSDEDGKQALKLALALVEKYAPGGKSTASTIEKGLNTDLNEIPAEIVADQAAKLLKEDHLFQVGRELEMASYHVSLPPFDALSTNTKSMLGALLDYAGVERERFALAWSLHEDAPSAKEMVEEAFTEGEVQPQLFERT